MARRFWVCLCLGLVFCWAIPANAQWFIYFYVGFTPSFEIEPLTENCLPDGMCIPDGRIIAVCQDVNDNGPDDSDPWWSSDSCSFSYWRVNGGEMDACGTATSEEWGPFWLTSHHGYLRVYCGDSLQSQYVSPMFALFPGQALCYPLSVWTCTSCEGSPRPPDALSVRYIKDTGELLFCWRGTAAPLYRVYSAIAPDELFTTLIGTTYDTSLTAPAPVERRLFYVVVASSVPTSQPE